MRRYPVPVQITEQERIIGGLLNFKQFVYIVAGASFGGMAGAAAVFLPVPVRFALFGMGCAAGMAMAFVKLYHTPLDLFLWHWFRWKRGRRAFYLKGDE